MEQRQGPESKVAGAVEQQLRSWVATAQFDAGGDPGAAVSNDAAVVEKQFASAAGADAQLVFFAAHLEAVEVALDQESGDAAIARLGLGVGKQ